MIWIWMHYLGSSKSRSVDDELIGGFIKGGSGFKTWDIGTVTQLCHGKATHHASQWKSTLFEPVGKLTRAGIALQGTNKQTI